MRWFSFPSDRFCHFLVLFFFQVQSVSGWVFLFLSSFWNWFSFKWRVLWEVFWSWFPFSVKFFSWSGSLRKTRTCGREFRKAERGSGLMRLEKDSFVQRRIQSCVRARALGFRLRSVAVSFCSLAVSFLIRFGPVSAIKHPYLMKRAWFRSWDFIFPHLFPPSSPPTFSQPSPAAPCTLGSVPRSTGNLPVSLSTRRWIPRSTPLNCLAYC